MTFVLNSYGTTQNAIIVNTFSLYSLEAKKITWGCYVTNKLMQIMIVFTN